MEQNLASTDRGIQKDESYVLLGSDTLLGAKVVEIIGRTGKCFGKRCVEQLSIHNGRVDSIALLYILSWAGYKKANGLIINSEIFLSYLPTQTSEQLLSLAGQLIEKTAALNLKIIFLYVKYPYNKVERNYDVLCDQIHALLTALVPDHTCFFLHSVYGASEQLCYTAQTSESVLADYAALFIAENIHRVGYIQIKQPDNLDGTQIIDHQHRCIFKLIYKLKEIDRFYGHSVAQVRHELGKCLAASVPSSIRAEIDCVCPVPKTGLYYAMGLAEGLNRPYIQGLLKSTSKERSFQIQSPDERKKFLWSKLYPLKDLIHGKCLAVVDEAIFTGATLKVVCELLWECGVKGIYLCIPSPKCRYHCNYLVHPPRPMLLEYIKENMLLDYFNCDGVVFQQDEIFRSCIERIYAGCCDECFFGG